MSSAYLSVSLYGPVQFNHDLWADLQVRCRVFAVCVSHRPGLDPHVNAVSGLLPLLAGGLALPSSEGTVRRSWPTFEA